MIPMTKLPLHDTDACKTRDKSSKVTDIINTSKHVEVSRTGGLCEPGTPDPFLVQVLILQAIMPCIKKVVWLCETSNVYKR